MRDEGGGPPQSLIAPTEPSSEADYMSWASPRDKEKAFGTELYDHADDIWI